MDERIMVNKYEETAKIFEQLPGMFLDVEVPSLLQHYEACIYQIKEMIPMENDPMLLESLKSILAQIEWQQEKVQDAYNSSVNQKQLQKVTQEKSPFQESKLQERKDKWIPCTSNTPRSVKIPFSLIPPEKIGVRNVLFKDFIKAINAVPKTISKEELENYNEYSKPI